LARRGAGVDWRAVERPGSARRVPGVNAGFAKSWGSPELARNSTSAQQTKVKVPDECEFARSRRESDNQKTDRKLTTHKKLNCGIAALDAQRLRQSPPVSRVAEVLHRAIPWGL